MNINPAPFRQGELDSLCGLYATINALRLLLASNGRHLSHNAWQDLFTVLVARVDDACGAFAATTNGVETKYLQKLLKAARVHLREEHEIEIFHARLLPYRDRPQFPILLGRLREIAARPDLVAILTIEGYISHWTVLRKLTERFILLSDSSGYGRLTIANCRVPYEPARSSRREYIVPPNAAFVVQWVGERELRRPYRQT